MNDDKKVKIDAVSVNDPTPVANTDPDTDASTPDSEIDDAERVEKLSAQLTELTDKYLRLAAELENTRRRAALDMESATRNRAMAIAKKFLPVMDAIDSATSHNPDDEGIKSMRLAMESAFAQIGITKIESLGHVLNPQFHNAIQVIDAPADADTRPAPNTIVQELQPGYMFGDTVLRTAMVVVCK